MASSDNTPIVTVPLPSLQELVGRNWLTIQQFADTQSVTYRTVLKWIKDGKLTALKVGGGWRLYEEEIRRFLSYGSGGR